MPVVSVEQCQSALERFAHQLSAGDGARRAPGFRRTLSVRVADPDVAFGATLRDGELVDVREVDDAAAGQAQIRLHLSGADLLALVDGQLDLIAAWRAGRVRVEANPLDLMRLRSVF